MKYLFLIAVLHCSVLFSQTIERVIDPEDYTSSPSVGYLKSTVEFNYQTYLKYITTDSIYTYYLFDGSDMTPITDLITSGSLGSYTASGTGIVGFSVDQEDPAIAYLKVLDDSHVASYYEFDGGTVTALTSPSEIHELGITNSYIGTINEKAYFTTWDEDSVTILLEKNGTSLEKVTSPDGYTAKNGIVTTYGKNTIDNFFYHKGIDEDSTIHLLLFDGNTFTEVDLPSGYEDIQLNANMLNDRLLYTPLFNTTTGVYDVFVYNTLSNSFVEVTGYTKAIADYSPYTGSLKSSALTPAFSLNGEYYFIYEKAFKVNTFYRLNTDDYTATELPTLNPNEGEVSYWKIANTGNSLIYTIKESYAGNNYIAAYFDGTNVVFPTMPDNFTGFNRGADDISDNFALGKENIYMRFSANANTYNNITVPKKERLLYLYNIPTNSFTGPLYPNDGETFGQNLGYETDGGFRLGNKVYHYFMNATKNGILYEQDLGCTEIVNTDIIDTAVTASYFTVPSGNYRVSTDGEWIDTLTSYAGCDSIVTYNVSFVVPPTVTDLAIVENPSTDAAEISDSIFVEGDIVYVKVSYSDNVSVSNILNTNPSIAITSIGKELVYHSYEENDVFFAYTVTVNENVNTSIILADQITLNGGEILNENLDNLASLDISEVNNLGTSLLTSTTDRLAALRKAISPNPFDEQIVIDLTATGEVHLTLMDVNGNILIKESNTSSINTSNLAQGMYLLYIESPIGTTHLKLIKQ